MTHGITSQLTIIMQMVMQHTWSAMLNIILQLHFYDNTALIISHIKVRIANSNCYIIMMTSLII